jgi:hypothetical protein
VVDLRPVGAGHSMAYDTNGSIQVGTFCRTDSTVGDRACMWKGAAGTMVDLHALLPPGFVRSRACSIRGKTISGLAFRAHSYASQAVIWQLP